MSHPLAKKFESVFGVLPEIIASAPGRVNFIGEHIDYSEGFVLPFALDLVTTVAISKRSDNEYHLASTQKNSQEMKVAKGPLSPDSVSGWPRYPLGVVWSLDVSTGLNILIDGKVPNGAGLSSSAALECSVALALNELFSLGHDRKSLALLSQKAENEFVGVPCGIMDQAISMLGKSGNALLLDCRDLATTLVPLDLASEGLQLLIVDTQAHHALTDGGYAERRAACESAAKKLGVKSMRELSAEKLEQEKERLTNTEYRRARHAVSEIERVLETVKLLSEKNFSDVGNKLSASHRSLRDDYNVSCPELDTAVNAAIDHGALGARMVGGGFGGSAIALIKQSDAGQISRAIEQAFASQGFTPPRFFSSLPSDGARIELRN